MRVNQNRLRELLLLAGLCGFFFFFRLSAIGLLGPDEPRYAQVAREMLRGHNWITPYLYGHTWLEKPILLYWGQMLSYLAFGISDWAARVPAAVAATLLVCGTFFAVRRIRPTARVDAALMVASAALVLGFARAAATDMLLAAPFALSLLAWYGWYAAAYDSGDEPRSTKSAWWLILFYVFNALATLAKGPVAPALAAIILIAFCAVQRDLGALRRTLNPLGIAAFLLVAAPWYLLVQMQTPEFFRIFFLQHNLARFGTNLYRHRQPFWYYIPVALAATIPWTVWMVQGVIDAVRELRVQFGSASHGKAEAPAALSNDDDGAEPSYAFEIFLLLWAMIPIVFFSFSSSKLPGYILPAVPALLILTAVAVHRRAQAGERPHWLPVVIHSALLGAIAAAVCVAPRLLFKLPLNPTSLMIAAAAGTIIFLIAALSLLTSGWRMLHFVTLLPMILAVGFLLRGMAPAFDAAESSRPIARLMLDVGEPGELPVSTFALNRNMAFGLAFYLDRRVAPYEGLEISPAVFELPPEIPQDAHIVVTREGSLPALSVMLSGRELQLLAIDRVQRIEIFRVSAAH